MQLHLVSKYQELGAPVKLEMVFTCFLGLRRRVITTPNGVSRPITMVVINSMLGYLGKMRLLKAPIMVFGRHLAGGQSR